MGLCNGLGEMVLAGFGGTTIAKARANRGMIKSINETSHQAWLKKTLAALPEGSRLLDAGVGELKNRQYCDHLEYVSQEFCQYQGSVGGHRKKACNLKAGIPRASIWSTTSPDPKRFSNWNSDCQWELVRGTSTRNHPFGWNGAPAR